MKHFPVTQWQAHLLSIQHHPEATPLFIRHGTLAEALRIQPGIDERRLSRAFVRLCKRHDTTRLQFRSMNSGWNCIVKDTHAVGLEVHDHIGCDESQMQHRTIALARKLIVMEDPALVRLDLLRFGALGDVVILRAHNSIVDGFGLTLMVKDLISYVLGMPVNGRAVEYQDYLKGWGQEATQEGASTQDAYWRDRMLPAPKPPQLGRIKRGLPPLLGGRTWASSKDLAIHLKTDDLQILNDRAKGAGVSLFVLLNAAFVEVLSLRGSVPEMLYAVNLGRFERDLMTFAGHHTLHPLMRHVSTPHSPISQVAQRVAEELSEMLLHCSTGPARTGGLWDQKLLALGAYPRQFLTGSNVPGGRVISTEFSSLFALHPGQEIQFGALRLSTFEMPSETGDLDELGFRLNVIGDSGALKFKYDADAYADDEIVALAEDVFARIGLALPETELIEG